MSSLENDARRLDLVAAAGRLDDYLRGYASQGVHVLKLHDAGDWQRAAREEFLRRRTRLVTAFDDDLLLAIGLGHIDVAAAAEALWRAMAQREG